jgi:hypothetical protein
MECALGLVPMNASDYLWPYQGAFCDNAFKRNHVVEVDGAQCSWIACVLAKAANVGTVVHLTELESMQTRNNGSRTTSSPVSCAGRFGSVATMVLSA